MIHHWKTLRYQLNEAEALIYTYPTKEEIQYRPNWLMDDKGRKIFASIKYNVVVNTIKIWKKFKPLVQWLDQECNQKAVPLRLHRPILVKCWDKTYLDTFAKLWEDGTWQYKQLIVWRDNIVWYDQPCDFIQQHFKRIMLWEFKKWIRKSLLFY